MKRGNKRVVALIIFVAIILITVGYAAITSVQLNIEGQAQATPNQSNFRVKFTGETEVSDSEKVSAEVDSINELQATMNVTGLTAKGDSVTATYTIENASEDLTANLSATTSNSNMDYFTVSYNINEETITAGETTSIVVTVKLIKTPVTEDENSTIGVTITADPVQPE